MSIADKLTTIAENEEKVYEAGKKAEHNAFWKILTRSGAEGEYYYTFSGSRWNKDNFKPTYNIVPTKADHTFFNHNKGGKAYDLAQHFEDLGIVIDFSNCTLGNYTFYSAVLNRLPEINNAKGTFTCFFRGCSSLVTIDKVVCSDTGDQLFTQTFDSCIKLKNIVFDGVIGRSINFADSPLTVESMKSIMLCLKDFSSTTDAGTYTLTLKSTCKTLMAEQGEIEEFDGKTYDAYITDKGWNLA